MIGLEHQKLQSEFADKFLQLVSPEPNTGCWIWAGHYFKSGYGCFAKFKFKGRKAHRASWVVHHGEIPDGMYVCHKCDNKYCVNPDHLFLGTAKDNIQDYWRKGKGKAPKQESWQKARGIRHGRSKLSEEQVFFIKTNYASNKELAKMFGVDASLIYLIRKGKIWRHIKV